MSSSTRRSSAAILGCVALTALVGCSSTATHQAGQPAASETGAHSANAPSKASPSGENGGSLDPTSPATSAAGQQGKATSQKRGKTENRSKGNTAAKQKARPTKDDKVAGVGPSDGEDTVTAASVLRRLPGLSGSCPAVGKSRDVRSGSMAAGPFDAAKQQFAKSRPTSPEPTKVRLYWIPKSGKAVSGGLVLKVTKVASGAETNTVKDAVVSDAAGVEFYDSQVPIAGPGTWEIKAKSGQDVGCFRVTFRR